MKFYLFGFADCLECDTIESSIKRIQWQTEDSYQRINVETVTGLSAAVQEGLSLNQLPILLILNTNERKVVAGKDEILNELGSFTN